MSLLLCKTSKILHFAQTEVLWKIIDTCLFPLGNNHFVIAQFERISVNVLLTDRL